MKDNHISQLEQKDHICHAIEHHEECSFGKERVSVTDTVDTSTIHHLYNNNIRLGGSMNTKTAQKMARTRTKLMHNFIDMVVSEWGENQ